MMIIFILIITLCYSQKKNLFKKVTNYFLVCLLYENKKIYSKLINVQIMINININLIFNFFKKLKINNNKIVFI